MSALTAVPHIFYILGHLADGFIQGDLHRLIHTLTHRRQSPPCKTMLKLRFLTGDRSQTVKNLLQKAKMRERSQDKKLQKVIKERDALRKQLACKVQQAYIFGV